MGDLLTTQSEGDSATYVYDKAGRTLRVTQNGEILIKNDLTDYKNRYFFESVKFIASNINISHKKITDTKWYLLFFGARDGT